MSMTRRDFLKGSGAAVLMGLAPGIAKAMSGPATVLGWDIGRGDWGTISVMGTDGLGRVRELHTRAIKEMSEHMMRFVIPPDVRWFQLKVTTTECVQSSHVTATVKAR